MAISLNPYLNFRGNTKEVMEFYHSVFGGELNLTKFSDLPGMEYPPELADAIMHADLVAPDVRIMASETNSDAATITHDFFSMSLSGDDEAKLRGYWDKLVAGGTVTMPLDKAPWGDTFGMFDDKFGIHWMVSIGPPRAKSAYIWQKIPPNGGIFSYLAIGNNHKNYPHFGDFYGRFFKTFVV